MLKLGVKVKPNSTQEKVEMVGDAKVAVWLREKPINNKANEAVVRLLATHFGVKQSVVEITSGHKSRNKVVEIVF